eukprot:scaffold684_cov345-Pavlova_lutheri.AAC.69
MVPSPPRVTQKSTLLVAASKARQSGISFLCTSLSTCTCTPLWANHWATSRVALAAGASRHRFTSSTSLGGASHTSLALLLSLSVTASSNCSLAPCTTSPAGPMGCCGSEKSAPLPLPSPAVAFPLAPTPHARPSPAPRVPRGAAEAGASTRATRVAVRAIIVQCLLGSLVRQRKGPHPHHSHTHAKPCTPIHPHTHPSTPNLSHPCKAMHPHSHLCTPNLSHPCKAMHTHTYTAATPNLSHPCKAMHTYTYTAATPHHSHTHSKPCTPRRSTDRCDVGCDVMVR